jgi:hypothetical protein
MHDSPKLENAPGHFTRPRKSGWSVFWQCRGDLAKRGFEPQSRRIAIIGAEPSQAERDFISDQCNLLQNEMLIWGRGGLPELVAFDGTIAGLCDVYQKDADSGFRDLRYRTRLHYDYLCRRLCEVHGDKQLAEVTARNFKRWHEEWSVDGKVSMGHAMMTMLRIIFNFGATLLEDSDCARLAGFLKGMRFRDGKPRDCILTADHVIAIRAEAHKQGLHSIALAQTLQYALTLRQKDVIGEWVPQSEPGISDVVSGASKWLRGLRWDEIDKNLILRHTTSKRGKNIEADLKLDPMVMEELARLNPLPTSGPMIVHEWSGRPYEDSTFRPKWRAIATAAGVPRNVRNMDSRAGAITEALEAGASPDSVRKTATHSDLNMTMRYSRGDGAASSSVMTLRTKHRNKSGTNS